MHVSYWRTGIVVVSLSWACTLSLCTIDGELALTD